ncbi:MAG: tetratricopeptide repeat protein [Saprospiraceae bacterium]|nr:tetratricopeptide repeat protein [Saprospiraceae bacterium]
MGSKHQLAVVMFTDIVGYSALMQTNEDMALLVAQEHENTVTQVMNQFNGEVANFMGDGSLCKLPSITDALDAALLIQTMCLETNPVIPLRIGIHWGDIIEKDGKIYGDGVNIASRIESKGTAGSVLFSRGIYDQIRNKSEYQTAYLGNFQLKNIIEPVAIFALTNLPLTVPKILEVDVETGEKGQSIFPGRGTVFSVIGIIILTIGILYFIDIFQTKGEMHMSAKEKSIAVLPFTNESDSDDQEYFAKGLSEDLIGALSKSKSIKVAARSSSFSFNKDEMDIRQIGAQLGVASVLDGNVRKTEDVLIINVELVDVSNGFALWNESFEKSPEDIFEIRDDITKMIVAQLGGEDTEVERIWSPAMENVEAYNLFLRGRHAWNLRTQKSLEAAVGYLEDCIALEPNYVDALAALADTYAVLGFYDYLPPSEAFQKSRSYAKDVLALDPDMAKAYATLGYVALYYDWDWSEAEKQFLLSIEKDPRYEVAHQWYTNFLVAMGRFDEAEKHAERALTLDPRSLVINAVQGWVSYYARQYERSILQFNEALKLDENYAITYLFKGSAELMLKHYDDALGSFRKALELSGETPLNKAYLAIANAYADNLEEAREILNDLQTKQDYVPAYEMSKLNLALGNIDSAIAWLNVAYDQRSHSLAFLQVDPQLDGLRDHPEFRHLMEKMDFSD